MKFINREEELKELTELENLSKKKLFVAAYYGLRRIGKTRLILEFLKGKGVYFFVNKNKTSSDLLKEYQGILRENGILGELEELKTWDQFAEIIAKRKTPPLFFDEFQNFDFVEPSFFGALQKNIDLNEGKPGFVILSGSLVGLMKKKLQSSKEPLYGRIKKINRLNPMKLASCLKFAHELSLEKEELIKLYGIFGGYPRYYVSVEDFGLRNKTAEEIIHALFLAKNAPLEDEVNVILSQEFGNRSGVYYSIMEAIGSGSNTISLIAGCLGMQTTSITRQINELKNFFELIEFEMPFSGKRGVYRIKHPLMQFWFSEIYRNYSDYTARKPEFMNKLKENLNGYFGKAFENSAKEYLVSKLGLTSAERQWGKIPDAIEGESAYEIDCIGRNESFAYVFEFKWSALDEKKAFNILGELERKAEYVHELKNKKTKLGIVAKKISGKQKLIQEGYAAYDLDDF